MRGKRFFWFIVMIALGALLGMVYGWVIHPLGGNESTLKMLRYDYQADYVLMIAEVYASDGNLNQAAQRISLVSDQPPAKMAADALQSARALDWPQADLERMENLARALEGQTTTSPQGEEQP